MAKPPKKAAPAPTTKTRPKKMDAETTPKGKGSKGKMKGGC